MSSPHSVLELQVQTLLEVVESHREARCQELRAEAERQRHALLAQAYGEARRRMHEAVEEERLRGRQRIAAARAQVQTRLRQRAHQTALLLLHQGWDSVHETLMARWKVPESRRRWIEALGRQALRTLPRQRWRIEHPPGWDTGEADALCAQVEGHCGARPDFRADNDVAAGLRLVTDGACLDGTLKGLLVDRSATEAQLLAQLNRLLAAGAQPPGPEATP